MEINDEFICQPEVISAYKEFEGYYDNGKIETSINYTYNCEECLEYKCKYWHKFH